MDKHLHIVMHDIPWPVSHGGFIDLYWKLVELNNRGILIHLHCFSKKEIVPEEIRQLCFEVSFYRRKTGIFNISFLVPYIVYSRRDKKLLENLLQNEYPVLFEGVHTTWWLYRNKLEGRKTMVRLHNVEHEYYVRLAAMEKNIFRKIYLQVESRLLRKYEKAIAGKSLFAAVSAKDAMFYAEKFNATTHHLPVFIKWQEVLSPTGKGDFCLYHGNLSIVENVHAAEWLIKNVFNQLEIPLVIAGMDPPPHLQKLIHQTDGISLIANPAEPDMQDLIKNAQVNLVASFNNTGVKLKLLNALFNGRHCIANNAAVEGSDVTVCCDIADTADSFRGRIITLFEIPFSVEMQEKRKALLQAIYDNDTNVRKLIAWLY